MLDFNDYQAQARKHRRHEPHTLDYTALRLTEEAGEVAGVVKRIVRKDPAGYPSSMGQAHTKHLADEMGDVLHALSTLADAAGFDLGEIAVASLKKQAPKKKRKKKA